MAADIFYACVGICGISFATSFGIAIMNPATVLSFMVAFALVKIPATATIFQECGIICGIIGGSLLWWIILSGAVCLFRKKVDAYIYAKVNKILGILIISLGIVFIFKR